MTNLAKTNLNRSHSNELIRKYTVCPLNPKYLLHLLGSCSVQIFLHERTVSALAYARLRPLLPHRSFIGGALPPPTEEWGVGGAGVLIQFAPGAVNRAQSGCCARIRLGVESKANQYKNLQPNPGFPSAVLGFFFFFLSATFLQTDGPSASQRHRYFKT